MVEFNYPIDIEKFFKYCLGKELFKQIYTKSSCTTKYLFINKHYTFMQLPKNIIENKFCLAVNATSKPNLKILDSNNKEIFIKLTTAVKPNVVNQDIYNYLTVPYYFQADNFATNNFLNSLPKKESATKFSVYRMLAEYHLIEMKNEPVLLSSDNKLYQLEKPFLLKELAAL